MDPDAAGFRDSIHEAFASPPSQSGRERSKEINHEYFEHFEHPAAHLPLKAPEANEPKGPEVKPDSDADDARASQPVQAPLPPGQGTRIDQLV